MNMSVGAFIIETVVIPFLKNWNEETKKKGMIATVDLLLEELEQEHGKNRND